jgi:hypothetical protein
VRVKGRDGLSVLLLCDDSPAHAPNVLDHVRSLRRLSRHRVDLFNPRGLARSRLLRFDDYDVVVVHFTVFVTSDKYLTPWFGEQLARFDGLKVQFIQDEYRSVDVITARMRELGIGLVFSSIPPDGVPAVYGGRLPGVDILPSLTGYVPAELESRPRPPLTGRPKDVVYRGRSTPYWLGRLGQEKVLIGREFLARAASTDLRCDVSWTEADRIYGEAWYRFLGSSRATLGTESGASIVDFDGSLQQRTEDYLRAKPGASFEEVEQEILSPFEGNAVIQAVSPRVFEAAALGTAMVNFTGRYSDVIEPWVHYIPLEKDFSNFDEVVAAIRDEEALDAVAARAHEDLVVSGRYSLKSLVREFDRELEARALPRQRSARPGVVRAATRPLLALDQLRSLPQLAEVPAVASLRGRAAERTGRQLVRRFPAIESLAVPATRGRDTETSGRLMHDLVRLAAAAAAHARELHYLGPPFDVRPELDPEGRRLTLVSTRDTSQDAPPGELHSRVETAIREGRLEEIVWDNSAVSEALKFMSMPIPSLQIGYHVIPGAHRFTALEELARDDPAAVAAALEPLFQSRPEAPVHELDPRLLTLVEFFKRHRSRNGSTARAGRG